MIFQFTIDKVLRGEKTQTRRLVKLGDYHVPVSESVFNARHRLRFATQTERAAQPGRGKCGIAIIRILEIRREDVREISETDARAEGFPSVMDFLQTWTWIHDPAMHFAFSEDDQRYHYWAGRQLRWQSGDDADIYAMICKRPPERYNAWPLTFELVKL